jgi:hypothetical protein
LQKNDDGSYATDENGDYIDDYNAQVTDNYTHDSNLQKAEIALVENAEVLVTVGDFTGGTITIDGVEYTEPIAYEKGETITINVTPADNYTYQYLIINGDKKFVELPYTYTLTGGDVEITPVLESSGITVSGTVKIATNLTGTNSTVGIIGLDIVANGEVVATTAKDGTFTATIPAGTTELTISGQSSIPRTVTLSGTSNVEGAIIPVVICDYNNDTRVNAADMSIFSTSFAGDYDVYCDYNGDGKVNAADMGVFSIFSGNTVTYSEIALG